MAKRRYTKQLKLDWFGDDLLAAAQAGQEPGLWALGKVILDEAERRAPSASGRLRRSGYVATTARSSYARQTRDRARLPKVKAGQVLVAFAAYYAKFLERGGADAHAIPSGSRRTARGSAKVLKIAGLGFRGAVKHPGMRRRAFLGPALDAKKEQGAEALAQEIRAAIESRMPRADAW